MPPRVPAPRVLAPRVLVVGAGVVGAACAWALSRAGARVTVVEAEAGPGQVCSARSFGWLNMSVAGPGDDLALRAEALALARAAPGFADRRGALAWEATPAATEAHAAMLRSAGAPVELVGRAAAAALAPELSDPPPCAVWAPEEGAIEPAEAAATLLAAAAETGARVIFGRRVAAPALDGGRATGAILAPAAPGGAAETLAADHVVIAAGAGALEICAAQGLVPAAPAALELSPSALVRFPMARPPARILAGPTIELRGAGAGQAVFAADPPADPTPAAMQALADRCLAAARAALRPGLVPEAGATAVLGLRPRPVPGPLAPLEMGPAGLTLAFAHPGVIFAPLLAARVTARVMAG